MTKLEELLRELCPKGVQYKKLGEVATDIFRGAGITRNQVCEKGTPCVRYGEIYTTYGIWFDKCVSYTDESILTSKKYFEHGDILFAITGESVEDIAKSCAYIGYEKCLAGGDIVVLKHNENPRYLAYALSTTEAQMQKSKGKVKSKVVHSSIPSIQAIRIPIPPLPVQREIVRILDKFTELTAELTAELTKELAARKKQYGYYRKHLLNNVGEKMSLKSISKKSCSGGTPLKSNNNYYTNGTIPWLRTQEVVFNDIYKTDCFITELAVKETSAKWIPANCVIVAISGASAGRCAINKIPLTTNQHCLNIEINSEIALYKYVFHCICSQYEELIAKKEGARGDLNAARILSLEIPVPPIEEQKRIVAVLDRFGAICNDITSKLSAEIEARQKQYEYYRDKLLAFQEVKA